MSFVVEDNFAEVWERTIQPGEQGLPAEAARYFLSLEFTGADRERMNQLALRASTGAISEAEQAELRNFMQLGWFLDLIKSKSRLSLGATATKKPRGSAALPCLAGLVRRSAEA